MVRENKAALLDAVNKDLRKPRAEAELTELGMVGSVYVVGMLWS